MAFGFVILAALLVFLLAIAGMGIYAVPVLILALLGAAFLYASKVKEVQDRAPHPDTPQDTPGGPAHVREDYAHEGQAHMTPEQNRRAGA